MASDPATLPAVDGRGVAISDHEVLAVTIAPGPLREASRAMKLISYNIQYGKGKDGRYDLARIAGEIEHGDVIALQEVERFWQRSGERDEPAELARHLRAFHWVYGANLDMDASYADADGLPVHRRRQFGTMILSRTPIISSRNFPLPKFGTLAQHSIQQGALEAVIRSDRGTPLRVYSTHLSHLSPATRLPQVEALLAINRRAPSEGGAWCGGHPDPAAGWTEGAMPPMPREAVLMGDFNFRPDAEEYRRIVGPDSNAMAGSTTWKALSTAGSRPATPRTKGETCSGERIDYIFVVAAWAVASGRPGSTSRRRAPTISRSASSWTSERQPLDGRRARREAGAPGATGMARIWRRRGDGGLRPPGGTGRHGVGGRARRDPGVRLVEVDVDTSAYEQGHVPGAIAWNWTTELSDPVRRDVLAKDAFERLMARSGHRQRHHGGAVRRQQQLVRRLGAVADEALWPCRRAADGRRPAQVARGGPRARHRRAVALRRPAMSRAARI